MKPSPCVISASEHAGWAHLVCVAVQDNVPAVIARRRVKTIEAGLPTMPYHHETLSMKVDEANALIARVRQSVDACSERALSDLVRDLAPVHSIVALAIRQSPFPELPETVAVVRQSYQLQCAADGMMYQLAMCRAARALKIDVQIGRRGEEMSQAAKAFGVTVRAMETFVSSAGRPPGPPWAEEHRRAYAAGIAVLAAHVRGRLRISSAQRPR